MSDWLTAHVGLIGILFGVSTVGFVLCVLRGTEARIKLNRALKDGTILVEKMR